MRTHRAYMRPVGTAMDAIGGTYKAHIVYDPIGGTKRYIEILKSPVTGDAENAGQAAEGIGEGRYRPPDAVPGRSPENRVPLTNFVETLVPIVNALCEWVEHCFEVAGVPVP